PRVNGADAFTNMHPRDVDALLKAVRDGRLSPEQAAERLKSLPYEDLGFAKVDHHRALRRGFPEVVFGAGKTPEQILAIAEKIAGRGQNLLVTRTTAEVYRLPAAPRRAGTRTRARSGSSSRRPPRCRAASRSSAPAPPTCRWRRKPP